MPPRHRTQADYDTCVADVVRKFDNGNGKSLDDLACLYRTKRAVIRQWLTEGGVRTSDGACIGLTDDELAQAIATRWRAGTTIRAITIETGLVNARVSALLAAAGEDTGVTWERRSLPEETIVARFTAGESIRGLARGYRCSDYLITRVLDDHNVVRPGLVARQQRLNKNPS